MKQPEKKECQGFLGKLFGHNYQPIFDVTQTPNKLPGVEISSYNGPAGSLERILKLTNQTYNCSICVRCGDTINQFVADLVQHHTTKV